MHLLWGTALNLYLLSMTKDACKLMKRKGTATASNSPTEIGWACRPLLVLARSTNINTLLFIACFCPAWDSQDCLSCHTDQIHCSFLFPAHTIFCCVCAIFRQWDFNFVFAEDPTVFYHGVFFSSSHVTCTCQTAVACCMTLLLEAAICIYL